MADAAAGRIRGDTVQTLIDRAAPTDANVLILARTAPAREMSPGKSIRKSRRGDGR
jgi:hypothetical protein